MRRLIVVNEPSKWPLKIAGVELVAARDYLTNAAYNETSDARVFNLCRSYTYQSLGYYVSLLAEARGHRPNPDVMTMRDMHSSSIRRLLSGDLNELIQKTLRAVPSKQFTLSVYFGRTTAQRDQALGRRLFEIFRCPLLRAEFESGKSWSLKRIGPIAANDIPTHHRNTVIQAAEEYFGKPVRGARKTRYRYDLAVLVDPKEAEPPSDEAALRKLVRAGKRAGVRVEFITREDYGRLGEFDALFIRVTTRVDHYTYRFARRAEAEGLAVIDDPMSIARCTNKVYLAELLAAHKIPIPRTWIAHSGNADRVLEEVGLPCVLKQPDSAFSIGVTRAKDPEEYRAKLEAMLDDSALVVVQEYMPTDYDWRVGVLDGKAIYACQYFMPRGHWQIYKRHEGGRVVAGAHKTMKLSDAPPRVLKVAENASNLIGRGLYGVDLKQDGKRVVIVEVNDNPSLEAGCEDQILKDKLYDTLIASFIQRIETIRERGRP